MTNVSVVVTAEELYAAIDNVTVSRVELDAPLFQLTRMLAIDRSVSLVGVHASSLPVLDAQGRTRVMQLGANADVILENLALVGGSVRQSNGGGILNQGALRAVGCTISDNAADFATGGGIFNQGGRVTMNASVIARNTASRNMFGLGLTASGGGIHNAGGIVNLHDCTLSENRAEAALMLSGGLINEGGFVSMIACNISHNIANGNGHVGSGAVYNVGWRGAVSLGVPAECLLEACLVSHNECNYFGQNGAGGLFNGGSGTTTFRGADNGGSMSIRGCTVQGNRAISGDGGGIFNQVRLNNCSLCS